MLHHGDTEAQSLHGRAPCPPIRSLQAPQVALLQKLVLLRVFPGRAIDAAQELVRFGIFDHDSLCAVPRERDVPPAFLPTRQGAFLQAIAVCANASPATLLTPLSLSPASTMIATPASSPTSRRLPESIGSKGARRQWAGSREITLI
jgi:hypothetical protein